MVVSFPSARIHGKESACSVEPQFCSLGLENLLEKGMAIHSTILTWKILWTEEPGGCSSWDHKESGTTERMFLFHTHTHTHTLMLERLRGFPLGQSTKSHGIWVVDL